MAKVNAASTNGRSRRNDGGTVSRSSAFRGVESSKRNSRPSYLVMVKEAILALGERSGSTVQKIVTFIRDAHPDQLPGNLKRSVQLAIRRGVTQGTLEQAGGKGARAKFKVPRKVSLMYDFRVRNVLVYKSL